MLFLLLFAVVYSLDLERIVEVINSDKSATWKAAVNPRFALMTKEEFKGLNMAHHTPIGSKKYMIVNVRNDIPEEFDSQKQWPNCETIGTIYDQGHCGSCWAMGAYQTLQDRFCIHSNGTKKPLLSAQHIVSCTSGCLGCYGGWADRAFKFCEKNGVTTEECIPYQMGTCTHPNCSYYDTPKCNRTCYPNTSIPVDKEKYFAYNHSSIKADEVSIQTEIMQNGPVTACFSIYDDFATYKSGVYGHITGEYQGLHTVKIIGWGVLDGTKYWKVVNSWNTDFGMDGFFLIKRGNNECGIEGDIVTVLPKL